MGWGRLVSLPGSEDGRSRGWVGRTGVGRTGGSQKGVPNLYCFKTRRFIAVKPASLQGYVLWSLQRLGFATRGHI